MDPFVDKIYFYLGLAYQKNGDETKACESFKKSQENSDGMVNPDLIKGCK
jgi:DNA-binding SARP family transcriptional activator